MVRFQSNNVGSLVFTVMVNDVERFKVKERQNFTGGWRLISLASDWFMDFDTLCEVETYVEELDK